MPCPHSRTPPPPLAVQASMASQRCCRPTARGARLWSSSCAPCTQTLTVALALTLSTLHPNPSPSPNPNPTSLGTPRTTAAASTPHGTRGRPTSSCSPTRGCRARTITLTSSTSKSYLLTYSSPSRPVVRTREACGRACCCCTCWGAPSDMTVLCISIPYVILIEYSALYLPDLM